MADEVPKLKKLTAEGVTAALDKADHYRLLNEPEAAESIYLDVLAVEERNTRALRGIVLAITDQFNASSGAQRLARAKNYARKLPSSYEQAYLLGLICEREAKGYLMRGMSSGFAYEGFRAAMEHYEEAEKLRTVGDDDPILRFNSCVRLIEQHHLRPRTRDSELPLE
ncbi:MAG: hypothetical protein OXR73_12810 [Myxococcales bacterium]|nr:hypothetical protein [Myxococcales bacterium]